MLVLSGALGVLMGISGLIGGPHAPAPTVTGHNPITVDRGAGSTAGTIAGTTGQSGQQTAPVTSPTGNPSGAKVANRVDANNFPAGQSPRGPVLSGQPSGAKITQVQGNPPVNAAGATVVQGKIKN